LKNCKIWDKVLTRFLTFTQTILKKYPRLIFVNTLLLIFTGVIETATIFTIAPIVDIVTNADGPSSITQQFEVIMRAIGLPVTLTTFIALFLLLNLFKSGLQIGVAYFILRVKYAFLRDLIIGTFDGFFQAQWGFFSNAKQGKLLNTFNQEMRIAGDAFGAIARFFSGVFQVILYLFVPLYVSWQVTFVSLGVALLFVLPFLLLGRVTYRLGQRNTATANQMMSVIQESFGAAKVILGYANQHKSVTYLSGAFEAHRRVTLLSQTINAAVPLLYFPLGLSVMVIALLIARRVDVPLSELGVIIYAFLRIIPIIGRVTGIKNSIDNFLPSYEQIMDLQKKAQILKQPTGKQAFKGLQYGISLENVSFAYPSQKSTLTNLNLSIPKGNMVAFVGESGAGKSTLLNLLMGFYNPEFGQIVIDGIPFSELDIYSYRQRIGYVPQDSILFNMTIKDNLLWAKETASDAEIKTACQLANADSFIEEFPDGYDTVAGDRGVRLSGGQIQRIALARAILRKPDVLILDEATSSLDTKSERLIQKAIENISKETTIIVIAHRLSTIANADYIYVLDRGCILEEGSYQQLLSLNGRFHNMIQLQGVNNGVLQPV